MRDVKRDTLDTTQRVALFVCMAMPQNWVNNEFALWLSLSLSLSFSLNLPLSLSLLSLSLSLLSLSVSLSLL